MTLEQTLKRSVKTEGGMSRGTGITVSVLVKWISSMPVIVQEFLQIEQFFGITFVTLDQQVDTRCLGSEETTQCVVVRVDSFSDWIKHHVNKHYSYIGRENKLPSSLLD